MGNKRIAVLYLHLELIYHLIYSITVIIIVPR